MEDSTSLTTRSAGIKYGLYYGLISVALFMVSNIGDIDQQSGWFRLFSSLILVAFIFLAHKYFKDNGNSYMSYGQGVGIGFWLSAVSGVISSVFMFIYLKFIDDTMLQKIKEKAVFDMEERGLTDEQIDQAMGFTSMFMSPGAMLFFGIFGAIFMGLVISLIVSIFTQKKDMSAPF